MIAPTFFNITFKEVCYLVDGKGLIRQDEDN
jgi:hypothetical protein